MFEQLYQQVEKLKSVPGVTRSLVMALPNPLRRILNTLMKRGRRGQISLSQLAKEFNLTETETVQHLLIDTHPGLNEETLFSIGLSDILLIILRPDRQDYQGTGVMI